VSRRAAERDRAEPQEDEGEIAEALSARVCAAVFDSFLLQCAGARAVAILGYFVDLPEAVSFATSRD